MITTCAADRSEFLLRDMKEYIPDLIPTTEVLNLLFRCSIKCSGLPQPGEWEGVKTEEEKAVRYSERYLSLLRDMESIKDQAKAKETAAAADDKGEGEEDYDDWDGNAGKNI